ncbi:hypothetical protein [Vibrio sp. SCSIO 43136]|uniref:hypothetical protein n=1 Tax=Vibrio sp. SCSIO 43136 TaxID=2819101 RepID=UPI002075295B|nr:hypothetical protein [Vibrio sp. SCSIO 43136]USD66834.1 hypothetical protein J4N39_19470 [Vibrio sp. SCSIO 43136]
MLNWLKLNPNLGLDKQPLFWISVLLPLVIAVGLGMPIWLNYTLEFSEAAYVRFMDISRLPLAVSTLSIPLGVLIGRIHGTKQTSLQIEKANLQLEKSQQQLELTYSENRKKNYLDHYAHFKEFVTNIDASISVDRLYRQIFPSASLTNGNLEVEKEYFSELLSNLSRSVGLYGRLRETIFELYDDGVRELAPDVQLESEELAMQVNLMCMLTFVQMSAIDKWDQLDCSDKAKSIDSNIISTFSYLHAANDGHMKAISLLSNLLLFVNIHHSVSFESCTEFIDKLIREEESKIIDFDVEHSGKIFGYT